VMLMPLLQAPLLQVLQKQQLAVLLLWCRLTALFLEHRLNNKLIRLVILHQPLWWSSQHPMRTRLLDNILNPKEFTGGTLRYPGQRGFGGLVSVQNPTIVLAVQNRLNQLNM
jgi:hypothetical protein